GRADGDGVLAAALLHAQPAARPLEVTDPAERVAVRLRRQLERRRDVRQLPAEKARLGRAAADQDRAAGGLYARSRDALVLRRLSLKTRLVLGVLVLPALGLAAAHAAASTSPRSFLSP